MLAIGPRAQMSAPTSHRHEFIARILVIEDNEDLAYGLRNNLEIEGYTVEVSTDGAKGLERVRELRPDLVVLDLMLPGLDGYRVLRAMRDDDLQMPVLILTARGEEADKVRGFRLGADDYVTKPFGILELMARIEALLRRSRGSHSGRAAPMRFGNVLVDPDTRTVRKGDRAVALTAMEFNLLLALLERPYQRDVVEGGLTQPVSQRNPRGRVGLALRADTFLVGDGPVTVDVDAAPVRVDRHGTGRDRA